MSARPKPPSALRGYVLVAIKAVVSLALLGWLVAKIDVKPVLNRLSDIEPLWAIAAIAILGGQILVTGWRWQLIAGVIGAPLATGPAQRLTLIGHFFSQTLPSAIGGDAVRAILAAREGMPGAKAASSVVIDRATALVLMVALMAVTLPLFFARVPDPGWRGGMSLLVGGALAGVALFLWLNEWIARLVERWRLTRPLAALARDFRRVLIGTPESRLVVASAIVVHLMVASGVWAIAHSLGIAAGLIDCWVMVPPVVLLTTLPISIAGWGVREGATVVAFGFIGVPADGALAISVVFGIVLIVVGIPGGLLWLRGRTTSAP